MLVSLSGVVKHGSENCINNYRTNIFKARLVTAVWRPVKTSSTLSRPSKNLRDHDSLTAVSKCVFFCEKFPLRLFPATDKKGAHAFLQTRTRHAPNSASGATDTSPTPWSGHRRKPSRAESVKRESTNWCSQKVTPGIIALFLIRHQNHHTLCRQYTDEAKWDPLYTRSTTSSVGQRELPASVQ